MEAKVLETLKARATDEKERAALVAEGYVPLLYMALCGDDEADERVLGALEVVFFLSLEAPLRPRLVAQAGMVDAVKRLMSRGRLKQKKVALATYKNLQARPLLPGPFECNRGPVGRPSCFPPHSHAQGVSSAAREDTASPMADASNRPADRATPVKAAHEAMADPNTPFLVTKKPLKGRATRIGADQARPVASQAPASSAQTAVTVSLFVEDVQRSEVRTSVENALLRRDGVISFFTDMAEEKVVIRTMCAVEALQQHIWDACKIRATATKGDYSTFNPSGYLDDKPQQKGWLSGFSSILQIIAVKDDENEPAAPAPVKSGRGQQARWLGSWW